MRIPLAALPKDPRLVPTIMLKQGVACKQGVGILDFNPSICGVDVGSSVAQREFQNSLRENTQYYVLLISLLLINRICS